MNFKASQRKEFNYNSCVYIFKSISMKLQMNTKDNTIIIGYEVYLYDNILLIIYIVEMIYCKHKLLVMNMHLL